MPSHSPTDPLSEQAIAEFRACTSPADRRAALCRYLRRGLGIGISQSELIDFLGVSTPSLLERAGYADDLVIEVMEALGTLTDDETRNE